VHHSPNRRIAPAGPFWLLTVCAVLLWTLTLGCNRNMEPFVEGEEARTPDLARIFPESGEPEAPPGQAARPMPMPASRRGNDERGNSEAPAGIRGTIAVSPELLDSLPPTGTLFVIARTSGVASGPPLAVLRIPGPQFPVAFEIGQEQVMIPGLEFQGEIQITARLDSDGNAMTKLPGDLSGAASSSAPPGTEGVYVILDSPI
jgi:hypothetical protein